MKLKVPSILLLTLLAYPLISQEQNGRSTVIELQQAFRDISGRVLPVVVEINVPYRIGSGVIIRQEGKTVYVVTNYHVIGGAEDISLSLYEGSTHEATLVGFDKEKDLALLCYDSDIPVPTAILGDSETLIVGDWVLAVGNPYGFESTVTRGIISATNREGDYIQTDAAINSGNSGGPLVNLKGEVIGINSWIASRNGGNMGLAFTIPINTIKEDMDRLISDGRANKGWLGVNADRAPSFLKEQMGLEEWRGLFVYNIYPDSPAGAEGIRPGDFLIALNGQSLEAEDDVEALISRFVPGETVKVTFVREGRELTRNIELSRREEEHFAEGSSPMWPGFIVTGLTEEQREQMGISRYESGLIITRVFPNSPAAERGLRNGDIVKELNGETPRDVQEFYRILNSENRLSLSVKRRGFAFHYSLKIH
ncbi:MAG: trypsin-like peptidase domain-containing protein [Spirochaetales bacterium]|nr:trypsin-like peptidase domain-containing protein [Spirochaetales bacterium]